MCGIVGYNGARPVTDFLLDALELLEYRGYDSAGLATINAETGRTKLRKCAGRVADLRKVCENDKKQATCGIGHTRWATHGGVSDENAHPHRQGNVLLVHNGIVENYEELRDHFMLSKDLKSETYPAPVPEQAGKARCLETAAVCPPPSYPRRLRC